MTDRWCACGNRLSIVDKDCCLTCQDHPEQRRLLLLTPGFTCPNCGAVTKAYKSLCQPCRRAKYERRKAGL